MEQISIVRIVAESCKHFYEGKNEGKRFSKLHEFLSKHIGTYERGPTEIPIQFFGSRPKPHFLYSSNPRRCMNNDRYQGFRIRHRIIDEAERSFDLPSFLFSSSIRKYNNIRKKKKINIFFFSFFFFSKHGINRLREPLLIIWW